VTQANDGKLSAQTERPTHRLPRWLGLRYRF